MTEFTAPDSEIVDDREKIDVLLLHLDGLIEEGLVMLEQVEMIRYRNAATD